MANRPINFFLKERQANFGKLKDKTVLQAQPTGRDRVSFENLCTEVARNTTFAPEELMAAVNMLFQVAKEHVENGDIVELGKFGTLTPSFKSVLVEKTGEGFEAFNANVHITRPVVKFAPSRKYFELRNVRFERVEGAPRKDKPKASKPAPSKPESGNPDGGLGL